MSGTNTMRLEIAQDMSAIEDMFARLPEEAINRAGDPDIPGGMAMVLLGPGVDIEAFGYAQMSELMGRTDQRVWMPDNGDVEPPLSFLASWSDLVREARGFQPSQRRATIQGEIFTLRSALDWMLSTNEFDEPWFIQVEDFAAGLRKVRRAMENVLHDGIRAERIRAECKECEEAPRLCVDRDYQRVAFYCPRCGETYDADGVAQCWHRMIANRSEDVPEWVTVARAAAATGRSPKTIRRWTEPYADGTVKVRKRQIEGQRVEVYWSQVWAMHDTATVRPWQSA